jgi:hypothetical protein
MCEPEQKTVEASALFNILDYADKWQVSRSTIFNWMRTGVLVRGRHYIKRGRVLRFFWRLDLIREIDEALNMLARGDAKGEQKIRKSSTIGLTTVKQHRPVQPNRTVANLNY